MPKQIKIGFDKVPAPKTLVFEQLYDIEGLPLEDEAGNPLVVEESQTLSSFIAARNALSTHLNNTEDNPVKVVEQFPLESEVSNSLLGVPRSEQQISLYSDVSTYGLDENNWNFYTFYGGIRIPDEWYNEKSHPIYGKRSLPYLSEESNEQALVLRSYPTQYSYPFGPEWDSQGFFRGGTNGLFAAYLRFIAIGKYLYGLFVDEHPIFASKYFISDRIKIVNSATRVEIETNYNEDGSITNSGDFGGTIVTVDYGSDIVKAFDEVEQFTSIRKLLLDDLLDFPNVSSSAVNFKDTSVYPIIKSELSSETARPGYDTDIESIAVLESKEAFRYQPGRISGFTYGVKLETDPGVTNSLIEWGCSNDTDEYMFQLKGGRFNIVRRSVIPYPTSLLKRMGLSNTDQTYPKYAVGLDNGNSLYETVISREKFNGDKLDGNGPSGYILQFSNVTMFKIEFSWYGAIGAKFYAYVPAGNGESRWVLIHTLVIENGSDKPILKNPNFKFKYTILTKDTKDLERPSFIYKYGSSYYIDGADEGTIRSVSLTGDTKAFTIFSANNDVKSSIIGVQPKSEIFNRDGVGIKNYQKAFPEVVSINCDIDAKIDLVSIKGSPDGVHHFYAPSLHNGESSLSKEMVVTFSDDTIDVVNTSYSFESSDNNAKVIGNGIYNCYVGFNTSESATLLRREIGDDDYGYILDTQNMDAKSLLINGSEINPTDGTEFTVRLSNYNEVACSSVPIRSNNFRIHFLNPVSYDEEHTNKHYADFAIGVTPYEPSTDNANNDLEFFDGVTEKIFSLDDPYNVSVEWTNLRHRLDSNGRSFQEAELTYGTRLENDPRIEDPDYHDVLTQNEVTGKISTVIGSVDSLNYEVKSYTAVGDGTYRVVFESAYPNITAEEAEAGNVAEVGLDNNGTGVYYVSVPEDTGNNEFQVDISGDISPPATPFFIQTKTVTLSSGWNVDSYDQNGEERFTIKRWSYSKNTRFNIQPLYLFIAMKDYAKVNNIVVQEIFQTGNITKTPNWLISSSGSIEIKSAFGSSSNFSPSNFIEPSRLSSIKFDTQTTQPLRPGTTINSFFVPANTTERVNLSNVFARDRKTLSTGLSNQEAIFFTATPVGSGGGNIELTLNVKEQ
jgi:hypothetical protein